MTFATGGVKWLHHSWLCHNVT